MYAQWLKEIMKDLPDNAPIVMLIHYNEAEDGLMAQVRIAHCVYGNDEDPRMHLLLTAYSRDLINDGRLKPTEWRPVAPSNPPIPASQPALPPPSPEAPPEALPPASSKELAVLDSKGNPGAIIKR